MDNVKKYLKTVFGKTITFIQEEHLHKTFPFENIDYELLTFKLIGSKNQYVLVRFMGKFDIRIKTIEKLISNIRKELDAIPVLVFDELRIKPAKKSQEYFKKNFEVKMCIAKQSDK